MRPIRLLGLGLLAAICLVLGVVGLVFPLIPGIPLLLIGVLCLAGISTTVRRRLHAQPWLRPHLLRWEASRGMSLWSRTRLGGWLLLAAVTDAARGRHRVS